MFYIFDGNDEFSRQEEIAALKAALGPADMVSLNTTRFDGAQVTFEGIRHACDSVPFLSDARLVIVEGLLTHLQGKPRRSKSEDEAEGQDEPGPKAAAQTEFRKRLLEYLPALPVTAHLVFVEPELLPSKDPFIRLVQTQGVGTRKPFSLPNLRRRDGRDELAAWVRERARRKGAKIEEPAVAALVELVGEDLRQLDSELEKLVTYCGDEPVTEGHVRRLVPLVRESVVWDLINALNARDFHGAMQTLSRLLAEGEPPLGILALITREYRLVLQAAELDSGAAAASVVSSRLSIPDWMAERALRSARATSPERLRQAYRLLLDTDVEIKTGLQDADAALEFLIARLCR